MRQVAPLLSLATFDSVVLSDKLACCMLTSQRTVADLEQIITLRFQRRENALIVECDALRADLVDAHSRLESELQLACGTGAEAVQLAAAEISIEEIRAERDAALQEVADLRRQIKEQANELRDLQKSSRSNRGSTNAVASSEFRQPQQPSRPAHSGATPSS